MRQAIQRGSTALAGLIVGGYAFLLIQQPLFGMVAVAGIAASYATYERGETADAAVLFTLWTVVAGVTWTGRLELIVAAIVVSALFYFGWHKTRGRGRPPT